MCKNQIDVATEVEDILVVSGLYYKMMYDPKTKDYIFILSNDSIKKIDKEI